MKINLWAACLMLALTLLSSSFAAAEDVELTSDYDQAEPAPQAEVSNSYAGDVSTPIRGVRRSHHARRRAGRSLPGMRFHATAATANNWSPPCADKCPRFGSYITLGVDSWRGVTNGTSPNNNGVVTSANGAIPLPWFSEYGFGAQFGGSYGVYNVDGKAISSAAVPTAATQQVFLTTGIFRRADCDVPIAVGFVHDWMLSTNLGTFGNSPTLGQWRSQVGYAITAWDEVGIWGSWRERGDSKFVPIVNAGQPGVQTYSAIDQLDLFWHHKFGQWGGDGTIYFGLPDQHRLNQVPTNYSPAGSGGSLGSFIVGTNWLVPISDRLSMYANGMYMKPSAHAGSSLGPGGTAFASAQDFWNISFGFVFYPDHAARSSTVAGRKWMPYLPVANNSSFMIDPNVTQ